MALEAAEGDGLLDDVKKMKKRNKEEIKAEEERIIRTVIGQKLLMRIYMRKNATIFHNIFLFLAKNYIYFYTNTSNAFGSWLILAQSTLGALGFSFVRSNLFYI